MEIETTAYFEDNVAYYIRKKKYLKIKADIRTVTDELKAGNLVGDRLDNMQLDEGTAAYKVRVANSSANVGKSNGFRIIYYAVIDKKAYLLTIYSKKDDDRIPNDNQIMMMIKNILD